MPSRLQRDLMGFLIWNIDFADYRAQELPEAAIAPNFHSTSSVTYSKAAAVAGRD